MRIAYVCADPGVPVFGCKGCSVHVQEMVRAFRKCGAEVGLFAGRIGGEPPEDLHDLPVYKLPANPAADTPPAGNGPPSGPIAVSRPELAGAGEFDLVYERYSLWSFAAMRCRTRRRDSGRSRSQCPADRRTSSQSWARQSPVGGTRRPACHCLGRCRHCSVRAGRPVRPAVRQHTDSIHIIPNGVNLERFAAPVDQRHISSKPITIGFIGSLKPWHGLPVLVKAFATFHGRCGNSRLLIIGDGPERGAD